jgi:hypothetical protein
MKKAIICTFALSLFALPMSLQANPPAKADAAKSTMAKPLSAMKSTLATPSKAPAATKAEDAAKSAEKALEEKADDAKKMVKDAGAKKAAGH